jgi:WD40 repeat protein
MSLIIENRRTDGFLVDKLWFRVILGISIFSFVFIFFYVKYADLKVPLSGSDMDNLDVELVTIQEVGEALPLGVPSGDLFDYGLNTDTPSLRDMEGYLIFTAYDQTSTQGVQKRLYYQDTSLNYFDPVSFVPDFVTYSALAKFDNLVQPKSIFGDISLMFSSEVPSNLSGAKHLIQKYNVETGALTAFRSIGMESVSELSLSSDSSHLAFTRLNENLSGNTVMSKREVIIVNIDKDIIVASIPNASQPKWSPDGRKLLYFHSDGLYIRDMFEDEDSIVVGITDGGQLMSSMFDVSSDGRYLVWTSGTKGVIIVYEIVSWKNFRVREVGRINSSGEELYWPQFSFDGEYYAVYSFRREIRSQNMNDVRIDVRRTKEREVLHSYFIPSKFVPATISLDSWIQTLPTLPKM